MTLVLHVNCRNALCELPGVYGVLVATGRQVSVMLARGGDRSRNLWYRHRTVIIAAFNLQVEQLQFFQL